MKRHKIAHDDVVDWLNRRESFRRWRRNKTTVIMIASVLLNLVLLIDRFKLYEIH